MITETMIAVVLLFTYTYGENMASSPVQNVEESPLVQLHDKLMAGLPHPDIRPLKDPKAGTLLVNLKADIFQIIEVVSKHVVIMIICLDLVRLSEIVEIRATFALGAELKSAFSMFTKILS